jgi:predicted permease
MTSAFQVFLNPVLPIFAILGFGILFAQRGIFDTNAASVLNRFVFYAGAPALLFSLLTGASLAEFEWRVLILYFTSEMAVYAAGMMLARWVFRRDWREAMLLGMTACFVNHVFFVLPMARVLYGEAASAPIAAIVVVDTVLIFALTIVALELSAPGVHSGRHVLALLIKHPLLQAIGAGLLVNLAGIPLHDGISTFTHFVGAAAAPIGLFALGIILSSTGSRNVDKLAMSIVGLKVLVHPLLAWLLFSNAAALANPAWTSTALLLAAGPCGAMPFVLALQYKVNVTTISRAVGYSTLLSLVTLAVMA